MHFKFSLLAILLFGTVVACQSPDAEADRPANTSPAAVEAEASAARPATYEATGVVRSVTPSGSHVVIRHEAIPGFMDAMTMPFAVADSVPVQDLRRDDRIRFTFEVGTQGPVIQTIEKAERP